AAQAQGLMEPMAVFALGEPEHAVDEIRRAMDLSRNVAEHCGRAAARRPDLRADVVADRRARVVDFPAPDLRGRFGAVRPPWRACPGGMGLRNDACRHTVDL